jgi:hypothetical protein
MSTPEAVILVCAAIIVLIAAYLVFQMLKTKRLRRKFGPEYDRELHSSGSRLRAEQALEQREKRVRSFQIRPLLTVQCERFKQASRDIQAHFVDDPKTAVVEADRLVQDVMRARGYPVEDFEQCAADVSVDHPVVVENYRAGHEIVLRHGSGQASTEDLRRAMIHYRTLFDDLLEEAPASAEPVRVRRAS